MLRFASPCVRVGAALRSAMAPSDAAAPVSTSRSVPGKVTVVAERVNSPHRADIDLSETVTEGKKLYTAWGDMPDFFHYCESPPCLWPYFTLPHITPKRLNRDVRVLVPCFLSARVALTLLYSKQSPRRSLSRSHSEEKIGREINLP